MQQKRKRALTYVKTESEVCCFSSGTTTWMKKETSNPLKIIVELTLYWRFPVAVSSYRVKMKEKTPKQTNTHNQKNITHTHANKNTKTKPEIPP